MRKPPSQAPPRPLISGGVQPNRLLVQNDPKQDSETTPLFLDPTTGEPRPAYYTTPNELSAQCAQYGHVEKTKYGALGKFSTVITFRRDELTNLPQVSLQRLCFSPGDSYA